MQQHDPLAPTAGDTVSVLFSGGRDSSLAASKLALLGCNVHLITCANGTGFRPELVQFRVDELRQRFPERIATHAVLSTFGIFRRIAIADIEQDFRRYGTNLILLGDKLAIHSAATVYCLEHGIAFLADGSTQYESDLAEQFPEALGLFREFERFYTIEYLTPVAHYSSLDEVKYELLDLGISTKSLESVPLFGDSFTKPSSDIVVDYINRKMPICHEYIARMLPSYGLVHDKPDNYTSMG